MLITVNGEELCLEQPITITHLLEKLSIDPNTSAIEKNLTIIPHSVHKNTWLQENDRIEIVQFIGGG